MAGYTGSKEDYLKRLRRIEGQVRGISRMVEEDVYYIDVLTQISAASKALQAVSLGLLEDHMSTPTRRSEKSVSEYSCKTLSYRTIERGLQTSVLPSCRL